MAAQAAEVQKTAARPVAVIVQQGKILDYIDGITQRNETPEEYVRQEIAKSLVREYGYEKVEVSVESSCVLGRESRGLTLSFSTRATSIIKTAPASSSSANLRRSNHPTARKVSDSFKAIWLHARMCLTACGRTGSNVFAIGVWIPTAPSNLKKSPTFPVRVGQRMRLSARVSIS